MADLIDRQKAIDALCKSECGWNNAECRHKGDADNADFCVTCDNVKIIKSLPSMQPERKAKGCEYCCEHSDGHTSPIEKRGHAFIIGRYLQVRANRWIYSCTINFCPMCGRKLRGE